MPSPSSDDPRQVDGGVIDVDRQLSKELQEPAGLRLGQPAPALGDQQDVGDFERPDRWHRGSVFSEPVKHRICRVGCLVFETPRHGDARIDDEHLLGPALVNHLAHRVTVEPGACSGVAQIGDHRLGSRTGTDWHEPRYRTAMLGDGDAVTSFHLLQQARQVGLGVIRADGGSTHQFRLVSD